MNITNRLWARSLPVTFWSLLVSAQLGLAGGIDPTNPAEGRFADDWATVTLRGHKVGYTHSTMARHADVIHSRSETVLRLGRVDQPVTLKITDSASETLAGRLLSFESVQDLSIQKAVVRGVVKDGRITIETSQFGVKQSQVFDYAPGTLFKMWGLFRESLIRGFKPGTEYTVLLYEPGLRMDAPIKTVTKVGDWEIFSLEGKKVRGQRVTQTLEVPVGVITATTWVDEHGVPIKALIPAPGLGDMEIVTTDEASALADFVPPEIFMKTVIKANRSIDAANTQAITYRLSARTPEANLASIPDTGMQKVINRTKNTVDLLVSRLSRDPSAKGSSRSDSPPARAEYLTSNLMINTKDKTLVALAQKAAGGETKPFALADRLRRFVGDYVKTKSLNIGFATASEVCRTREGDCTEHGVLLAALGRINHLPSRVAVGLAYVPYFGGERDIFGYHLWTQFYIDGRWYDYDAALGESDCSPIRIAFATSSLKNAGLADLSLPLLGMIGSLDLKIVDVKLIEKPHP